MSRTLGSDENQRKSTVYTWFLELQKYRLDRIQRGYEAAKKRHPNYPPTLPQFIACVEAAENTDNLLPPAPFNRMDAKSYKEVVETCLKILDGRSGLGVALSLIADQDTPQASSMRQDIRRYMKMIEDADKLYVSPFGI